MHRAWSIAVCALVALVVLGTPAWAGEVVLANGDVLKGNVVKDGDHVVVQHPELGSMRLETAKLRSYVLGAAPPPSTPPPAPAPDRVTRALACEPCSPPSPKVDIECKRPWDFGITFAFSNEHGNTEELSYVLDLEGEYRWRGVNTLSARWRSSYEEAFKKQTEGKLFSTVAYERQVSARGKAWAKWLMDRDDFADLLLRMGWFAGYAYDFVKRERTTFTAGAGAGYVTENRVGFPVLNTAAFIAIMKLQHEFRGGDTFKADYWVIPYVDETERSPMRLELRYTHPLRNHFDIAAGFIFEYVPEPPDPAIKSYDTTFTVGVRWKP